MKKVILYTTRYCPYCTRAKTLLERKKISFTEVDLSEQPEKRDEISNQTGWSTVPMIYIGEEFIGGCDDLYELEGTGELDKKLGA